MNIRPIGKRVLVEPIVNRQSGVIIELEKYQADPFEWRVMGVSEQLKGQVEVGWRVLSHAYSAKHLNWNDTKFRILDWADVLMVLPP